MLSVHDNWVYAHAVDYQRCRLVLHTVFPHVDPPEFTDVLFEGVTVHHFEEQKSSQGSAPTNVLFDVEEYPAELILKSHLPLLERLRNYGWPVLTWNDVDDLVNQLSPNGVKCFKVHGTCGLDGFVFARSMDFRSRAARAEVTDREAASGLDTHETL